MTGTLAMAAASSMFARIKFGTSRSALQRCFGAVHLALCEKWVTLIGRERQIATSWLAGKSSISETLLSSLTILLVRLLLPICGM
jgi:hypothetical protein